MNRIIKSLIALLALSLVFTACGGGGGGTTTSGAQTGTFSKEVAYTGSGGYWGVNLSERVMMLYLAGDIKGSGMINSVFVKHENFMSADVTCTSFTLNMGHTNATNLVATFANNVETGQGSFQTVRSGSITIPAGPAEAYFPIPLSQPFNYNGVDNLVVDVTYAGCNGTVSPRMHQTSPAYNGLVYAMSSTATSGTLYDYVTDAKFNFAGGDNKVDFKSSYNANAAPLSTTSGMQKVQMLYNTSAIAGSGPVTGIGLQVAALTTNQTYTYTMKLGHSTKTSLDLTWVNNFNVGSPVTVASSVPFTVPAGVPAGGFIWLPIPINIFTYNGTDNLVVELTIEAASGPVSLATHSTLSGGANATRIYGDPSLPTASTTNTYTHQIALRFAGGTMDVILPGTGVFIYPFNSSTNNKSQHLYTAAELGTKGTITKVARRLVNNSTASDYNSFTVVLGYATNTTLGTTFSANMTGAQTVYSGTFSVPAGLKAGDWVEIPLSTPFAYDGTRNLVIQMSTLHGTANNYIIDHSDAARYLSREAFATSNTTDTTSTIDDWLAEVRLTVQ